MAYFQRARAGGGGTYLQRLTKLYSDAKQSYESAKVVPDAFSNTEDDPDVRQLRREFQIQQDRLLAWGMHWADVEAQYAQTGQEGGDGGDVDIDKKIDQAGLGEVVASVMSQIKSLLDESGRLQHPEKFELAMRGMKGMRGPPGMAMGKGMSPTSPMGLKRKEWSQHEVQTGRTLLEQLTTCIDVLYSLSESRTSDGNDEKVKEKMTYESNYDLPAEPAQRTEKDPGSSSGHIGEHPLHIDFDHIDFDDNSTLQSSDPPPPYETAEERGSSKDRCLGYYRGSNKAVLVDFLPAECPPYVVGTADELFELHELGEKLCRNRSLSWSGHLRLIGFTIDPRAQRCGMVYELPPDHSYHNLQNYRTLGSAIAASHNHESAQPPLEDRFRLSYNLVLSVLGYFAQADSHRYITSENVLLIGKDVPVRQASAGVRAKSDVRSPYLLQSGQDFASQLALKEPLTAAIYHHPSHDSQKAESIVPALDIYSLGLILLEIGLWIPLTKLWKPKYDRKIFMERVQRIYSQKLASKCGSKYMRLVQRCLHAPTELLNQTKPEQAGAYLLDIVKDLRLCCALDDEGMPPNSDLECFELLIIEQLCKTEELEGPSAATELPLLQIPGAFDQPQESGIIRSEPHLIPRKQVAQAPSLLQPAPLAKKRNESASNLRKWPELQISQQDLDQWNTNLMPRLQKLLQDVLQDSAESCSVSLMKIGTSVESAKTTICIQCASAAKVNECLRKRFKPKKGWGVVIMKGDVKRSGTRRKPRRQPRRSGGKAGKGTIRRPKEQKYQEKPSCGASIGAFKDNEHLPPVSFGGTILVDGEPFGMTVHHMLDEPSDDEEDDYSSEEEKPYRSSASQQDATFLTSRIEGIADLGLMPSEDEMRHLSELEVSDDEEDDASASDSDASTIRPDYSITDGDGNQFWFLEDSESLPDLDEGEGSEFDENISSSSSDDEDDAASVGDKVGIAPYADCDELTVTQPAIDDVDDDFFPCLEDRDDDHLLSHTFGVVHASSGIRRVVRGHIKHEVDWALIRVDKDRLDICNTIPNLADKTSPSNSTLPTPNLTTITSTNKLSSQSVSCCARSSGFSSGRISQAMSLVKLHGRHTFSASWCVDSTPSPIKPTKGKSNSNSRTHPQNRLGIPGDSGAWVYNPTTGELCGHVLAYGEKMKQAYIAPMEVLFEDIRSRLGAERVELPGSVTAQLESLRTPAPDSVKTRTVPKIETQILDLKQGSDIETSLAGLRLADSSIGVGSSNLGEVGSSSSTSNNPTSNVPGNVGSNTTTAKERRNRKTPEVQISKIPMAVAGIVS